MAFTASLADAYNLNASPRLSDNRRRNTEVTYWLNFTNELRAAKSSALAAISTIRGN
jgi:hypothetical protein